MIKTLLLMVHLIVANKPIVLWLNSVKTISKSMNAGGGIFSEGKKSPKNSNPRVQIVHWLSGIFP